MSFREITDQILIKLNDNLEFLCMCELEFGACRNHAFTVQMVDDK
jgi:hypothetical protein